MAHFPVMTDASPIPTVARYAYLDGLRAASALLMLVHRFSTRSRTEPADSSPTSSNSSKVPVKTSSRFVDRVPQLACRTVVLRRSMGSQ